MRLAAAARGRCRFHLTRSCRFEFAQKTKICCLLQCSLSVTKWVHLNWGDDGLITLFSKIWRLLCPGGVLVLEPQPWKSYENNHLVFETTAMNYRSILFRPAKFQEILLDKVSFKLLFYL
nr:putative rna methyltransferase at5g51130 [Quercus suber]